MTSLRPLTGTIVLDLSRMLPGAVLTRMLVDLGARVIKVEDPGLGDPMRAAPPLVEGVSAGFRTFMRDTESICLDLRSPEDAATLRKLARQADVLVESFRPGTLARWGLGPDRLMALNASLIVCSLSGFGANGPMAGQVAHDVNLMAASGLLAEFPGTPLPRVQIADVTTGMLACSAILAALLQRHRTHRGMHLDQPMAMAPLPFLTWAWADGAAHNVRSDKGTPATLSTLLAGEAASYGIYRCKDGLSLAVGAIEPKFWAELADLLNLRELAGSGFAVGAEGKKVRAKVEKAFAGEPRAHWLELAENRNLPLSPVNDLATGTCDPMYATLREQMPLQGGGKLAGAAPYIPAFGVPPQAPAPTLGQHTQSLKAEFGL